MTHNDSHEHARNLQAMADYLLARPAFDTDGWGDGHSYFRFYDKDKFIAAVRALGSGEKTVSGDDISFAVKLPGGLIKVEAPRDVVCRLIRPAEYECIPFLSPEEESKLEAAAAEKAVRG